MHPTSRFTRSRPARWAVAAAVVVFASTAVSGCGSKDDGSSTPAVTKLTQDQATSALLTEGNLGGVFKLDDSADHSTAAPGCLTAVDEITDKSDAPVKAVRDFAVASETGFPLVSSQVESFASTADAEKAVGDLRTALASCTSVNETDGQGAVSKLVVSSTDDKTSADTDDQLNVSATGTFSSGGQKSPIGLWLAVMREQNNLTLVTVGALAAKSPGDIDLLIKIVNDRLTAVASGKTPDDSVVAGG